MAKNANTNSSTPSRRPVQVRVARSDRSQSQTQPQSSSTNSNPPSSRPSPGRQRNYLNPGNGREFDVTNPKTPEGRLVDPESLCWHVPSGQEPYLKPRRGVSVKDIQAKDVGRYRLTDFNVRATDDRGHGTSIKVHLPQQVLNELDAIVNSKVFPTRSLEGLARSFIFDGIEVTHAIAKQDGLYIPNSHKQQIDALAILNRSMQSLLQYDALLDQNCDMIRALVRKGVINQARKMVYQTLEIVDKMESQELRERWLLQIKREFTHLMKGRPARVRGKKEVEESEHGEDEDER